MLLDLRPTLAWLLLLPDERFAVVRARREDAPELGVCPCNLPHRAGMPAETRAGRVECMQDMMKDEDAPLEDLARSALRLAVYYVKDTHSPVGRTGGEPFSVVIQLGVMLASRMRWN